MIASRFAQLAEPVVVTPVKWRSRSALYGTPPVELLTEERQLAPSPATPTLGLCQRRWVPRRGTQVIPTSGTGVKTTTPVLAATRGAPHLSPSSCYRLFFCS